MFSAYDDGVFVLGDTFKCIHVHTKKFNLKIKRPKIYQFLTMSKTLHFVIEVLCKLSLKDVKKEFLERI